MNWKHYAAIAAPYVLAAVAGVALFASHSTNALEASIGLFVLSALNHGNVLGHASGSDS